MNNYLMQIFQQHNHAKQEQEADRAEREAFRAWRVRMEEQQPVAFVSAPCAQFPGVSGVQAAEGVTLVPGQRLYAAAGAQDRVVVDEALRQLCAEAYAAFRGAFDTPVARRKVNDEYAADARRRIRELCEAILGEGGLPPHNSA